MNKHGIATTGLLSARLNPATIETIWAGHKRRCERCQLWDEVSSAGLVHVCPEGAQYAKVLLAKRNPPPKRERVERSENYVSKERLKQVMRYRE